MRVLVCVKASKASEAGQMPTTEQLTAMGKFNEELVKAGIMLSGEGLHPTSKAKRVKYTTKGPSIVDGPFAETKEMIAGFWMWQVRSMEEAVEWLKRCPMNEGDEVDIRPVFEAADFGAELTPELRDQEERLRAELAQRKP
ncbi:MAG: YciI family protein [Bryobacteraceae bacterium]